MYTTLQTTLHWAANKEPSPRLCTLIYYYNPHVDHWTQTNTSLMQVIKNTNRKSTSDLASSLHSDGHDKWASTGNSTKLTMMFRSRYDICISTVVLNKIIVTRTNPHTRSASILRLQWSMDVDEKQSTKLQIKYKDSIWKQPHVVIALLYVEMITMWTYNTLCKWQSTCSNSLKLQVMPNILIVSNCYNSY